VFLDPLNWGSMIIAIALIRINIGTNLTRNSLEKCAEQPDAGPLTYI
jgi:hypothetical protein